jgi:hypothetical protein
MQSDDVVKWVSDEALILGSEIAGFLATAEIASPLIYLMAGHGSYNYKTGYYAPPLNFTFSINDLAKITAVGYPIMAVALRLPPIRYLGFSCGDEKNGKVAFSVLANFALAPATLALGAKILDIDFSVTGAFLFGYAAPPFGLVMAGVTGYAACLVGCWVQENGSCLRISFPKFSRESKNEAPAQEREIPEIPQIEGEQDPELSLGHNNQPRPIIFSQDNSLPSPAKNEDIEAQLPKQEDTEKRRFACNIL